MKRVQSNLKRFSQSPVPDVLHKYLVSNYSGANYFSVYEAGFCGIWIHEKLMDLGITNIVVNPIIGKTKSAIFQDEMYNFSFTV